MIKMEKVEFCIRNSCGDLATVGSKVILRCVVHNVINRGQEYTITGIKERSGNEYLVLDDNTWQPIAGIIDFIVMPPDFSNENAEV